MRLPILFLQQLVSALLQFDSYQMLAIMNLGLASGFADSIFPKGVV